MLYIALSMGKTPETATFPLGFQHPAGGRPSQGRKQHAQKIGKDGARRSGDIVTHRQTNTNTDVLITILGNRSYGRSKNNKINQ